MSYSNLFVPNNDNIFCAGITCGSINVSPASAGGYILGSDTFRQLAPSSIVATLNSVVNGNYIATGSGNVDVILPSAVSTSGGVLSLFGNPSVGQTFELKLTTNNTGYIALHSSLDGTFITTSAYTVAASPSNASGQLTRVVLCQINSLSSASGTVNIIAY